ncbi:sensor histidine kinase [Bacillus niameyensis]|uniref:sensor histidine kinase n=1 Tax=Bacillus niameyensis TaxID=1522308 RepID=UPI0007844765|nr:HAMP domain-containing sensor histidine kinase [Bacillus niameyensis]
MKWRNILNFRHSLLLRYLIIIFIALLFLPIIIPMTSVIWYSFAEQKDTINGNDLEKLWHEEANKMGMANPNEIEKQMEQFQNLYKESSVFWVDSEGKLIYSLPERTDLPTEWTSAYTVEFMKKSYDSDPFTSVAFIGEQKDKGFIVFQIPRVELDAPGIQLLNRYYYLFYASMLGLFLFFIFISWLFFYRMRKRLLNLQRTMEKEGEDGIPEKIVTRKKDEIGQLEQSFNHMVQRLEESRKQQTEEENLRRQLIANLSHDLRTPLTTLRGQLYSLKKEKLTEQGQESLALIDHKITYLGQLIDNLLSYTLLTTKKYPYHPQKLDLMRIVRTIAASWYPTFEKEGFIIEIDLPERLEWVTDPSWLERVLDNLFQNIIRHAKDGQFIGITGAVTERQFQIIIKDRGPGFGKASDNKGVGIGMAIVTLMLQEMKLKLDIEANKNGTVITISGKRAVS